MAAKLNKFVADRSAGKEIGDPKQVLFRAFFIYPDAAQREKLAKWAEAEKLDKIGLAVLPAVQKDVLLKLFKIPVSARNTLLIYRDKTVTANFVNVTEKDFPAVMAALEETCGPAK